MSKYVYVQQYEDTDCGIACLVTVAKYYGLKVPFSKLRNIAGTDLQGTTAYGIELAGKSIGFDIETLQGTKEDFLSIESGDFPFIAHTKTMNSFLHFVVVYEITKNRIIVADPAKGIIKYKHEEFFDLWTGVILSIVPNENFKKGSEIKSPLVKVKKLLFPYKKALMAVSLYSLLIIFVGISLSFYMQFFINYILPRSLQTILLWSLAAYFILSVFKELVSLLRSYTVSIFSQALAENLTTTFFAHMLELPVTFFKSRRLGTVFSRFADTLLVRQGISSIALSTIVDIFLTLLGMVFLFFFSPYLLIITIVVLVFFYVIMKFFYPRFIRLQSEYRELSALLDSFLLETILGIETIKAFLLQSLMRKKGEKKFKDVFSLELKAISYQNVETFFKNLVQLSGEGVILVIGANLVLFKIITLGEFLTYSALISFFLQPLRRLTDMQILLTNALVSSNRLTEVMDEPLEIESFAEKSAILGDIKTIEFDSINFRYGIKDLALKEFTFRVTKGEKIAFIGESGSGKTTVAKLIMNFYKPESGEIRINGLPMKTIDINELRSHIGYIPQEVFLFNGTIKENLTLGAEISEEDLVHCTQLTHCYEFISGQKAGFDTILSENGLNLSGGQRQRLAIARALLKRPTILILDEATSNLDIFTENMIIDAIEKLCKDCIVITIAHRLSLIKKHDRIYLLKKGEIDFCGSYENVQKKFEEKGVLL